MTQVADDPETLRIRNTSKIISNVNYHGEYEKKKQMEERRNLLENDNNNGSMQHHSQQFKSSTLNDQEFVKNVLPFNYTNNNNNVLPMAKNITATTNIGDLKFQNLYYFILILIF